MPLTHEFGIVENLFDVDENKYEPEKYNCISLADSVLTSIFISSKIMKTYWHSTNRPGLGFAYHGITLIPSESLQQFREVVLKNCNRSDEILCLDDLIAEAIRRNKYIIHFGI